MQKFPEYKGLDLSQINKDILERWTAAVMVAKIIVEKNLTNQVFIACKRSGANAVRKAYPQVMICNMERYGDDISRYVRDGYHMLI